MITIISGGIEKPFIREGRDKAFGKLSPVTVDGEVKAFLLKPRVGDNSVKVTAATPEVHRQLVSLLDEKIVGVDGKSRTKWIGPGIPSVRISIEADRAFRVDRDPGWEQRFMKAMEELFGEQREGKET